MAVNQINNNESFAEAARRIASHFNSHRQSPRVFPLPPEPRVDGDSWLRETERTRPRQTEDGQSLWASYNAAGRNISNATGIVDAHIGHLMEINRMLTLIRAIIDDASDPENIQSRQAMQYQIDSYVSNIDASSSLGINGISASIAQNSAESVILSGSVGSANPPFPDREVTNRLNFQVGIHASQSWTFEISEMNSSTMLLGDGRGRTDMDITNADSAELDHMAQRVDNAMEFVTNETRYMQSARSHLNADRRALDINQVGNDEMPPRRVTGSDIVSQAELERRIRAEILRAASVEVRGLFWGN